MQKPCKGMWSDVTKRSSPTCAGATAGSNRVDGRGHRGRRVEKEVAVLAALLLLVPTHAQRRVPRALPPVQAVVGAIALMVV